MTGWIVLGGIAFIIGIITLICAIIVYFNDRS